MRLLVAVGLGIFGVMLIQKYMRAECIKGLADKNELYFPRIDKARLEKKIRDAGC